MYELRPPSAPLRPFIEHYWFVRADEEPVDLRVDVFVDGRADLVFNFGDPYLREVIGGPAVEHTRSNLDAQRLEPIRISQRGRVRIAGVRFHLGGLGPFVSRPLRSFTGQTPDPTAVFGDAVRAVEHDLERTDDLDASAALLDAFFEACLTRETPFDRFDRALRCLVDSHGTAGVEEIASAGGVSSRHLERLFARYLGIAPKMTGRILRFQRVLRALMRDPGCPLARLAAEAGYFDQAHFIKDFKRMSGGVPRGYRGYYPPEGPADFAPNVVVFLQDGPRRHGPG
ncbi:MAG: helix-turn-helix domain-containing protein [Vicinamibacterales bacterium]